MAEFYFVLSANMTTKQELNGSQVIIELPNLFIWWISLRLQYDMYDDTLHFLE